MWKSPRERLKGRFYADVMLSTEAVILIRDSVCRWKQGALRLKLFQQPQRMLSHQRFSGFVR